MTRTFVGGGEVTEEVAALRDIAREALEAARAAARPGVTGRALYDAACDVVERAGYPTQRTREPGQTLDHGFYFGLGHGVGLEVHEPPGPRPLRPRRARPGRRRRDRARHRGHRGHRRRPLRGPPADHGGRQRDADRLPLRPVTAAQRSRRRAGRQEARDAASGAPLSSPKHAGERGRADDARRDHGARPSLRAFAPLARPLAERSRRRGRGRPRALGLRRAVARHLADGLEDPPGDPVDGAFASCRVVCLRLHGARSSQRGHRPENRSFRDRDRQMGSGRLVADGLDVVAVGVEHVGAVVVRVVDLAHAGGAVVGAAGLERGGVEGVDGGAVGRLEGDVDLGDRGCGRPRARRRACRPCRSRPRGPSAPSGA